MQIVRTFVWVLIFVGLLLFSWFNWTAVEVTIWENLLVETKVPALVIVSFLLGLLPMWIYHRGVRWTLTRKIASLENAARTHIAAPPARPEDRPDGPATPAPATAPATAERDPLAPETDRP